MRCSSFYFTDPMGEMKRIASYIIFLSLDYQLLLRRIFLHLRLRLLDPNLKIPGESQARESQSQGKVW